MKWAGTFDMYRKIPVDLMEGTRRGSALSYVATFAMIILFMMETRAYFEKTPVTDLALDSNKEPRVRVNFNITMMDLKCEYTVVDVVSVLGTQQNVASHVTKWEVDAGGVRQRYQGRNKEQRDLELFDASVTETIEDLHENGEDAINLDIETFQYATREQEYLFVDFFASWCSHCRQLAPTWETLAEVMSDVAEELVDEHEHEYSDEEYEHARKVQLPVMIAKVDCVDNHVLCSQQNVMAYPTLRLFVDGKPWRAGDYRGHRTVVEMADWLQQIEDTHKTEMDSESSKNVQLAHRAAQERMDEEGMSEKKTEWSEKVKRRRQRMHHSWVDEDHPGCQLSGHLLLDRVPGNFHIQARSDHHDMVPHMTNVSHVIHELSIGEPMATKMLQAGKVKAPADVMRKLTPMDGNVYVTHDLHEAHHHYLKVVTTAVEGLTVGYKELTAYQILSSSQLSFYSPTVVPEAKFVFDLSPVAVKYRTESRHWYDYITSVMAIVGGTFVAIGMIESSVNVAVSKRRRY